MHSSHERKKIKEINMHNIFNLRLRRSHVQCIPQSTCLLHRPEKRDISTYSMDRTYSIVSMGNTPNKSYSRPAWMGA